VLSPGEEFKAFPQALQITEREGNTCKKLKEGIGLV